MNTEANKDYLNIYMIVFSVVFTVLLALSWRGLRDLEGGALSLAVIPITLLSIGAAETAGKIYKNHKKGKDHEHL